MCFSVLYGTFGRVQLTVLFSLSALSFQNAIGSCRQLYGLDIVLNSFYIFERENRARHWWIMLKHMVRCTPHCVLHTPHSAIHNPHATTALLTTAQMAHLLYHQLCPSNSQLILHAPQPEQHPPPPPYMPRPPLLGGAQSRLHFGAWCLAEEDGWTCGWEAEHTAKDSSSFRSDSVKSKRILIG